MKKVKRLIFTSLVFGISFVLLGCEEATETAKKVSNDVTETIQVETTKDNKHVNFVKNGYFPDYPDVTVEDAFKDFFSSPSWKYFEGENKEKVVEFTGYCTYMEKKVKAKLQFIVDEDMEIFEIGALEFNEIPQDESLKIELLTVIFEEYFTEEIPVEENSTENTSSNVDNQEGDAIEKVKNGISFDLVDAVIGDVFSEPRFDNGYWYLDEYGDAVFNGNFSGEIFPGEESNLEFTFSENEFNSYDISNMMYNGEQVPYDNYWSILDLLEN